MKNRYKIPTIAGIVAGCLALLVMGVAGYIKSRGEAIVKREFSLITHGRYRFDARNVKMDIFARSITFDGVTITPDSTHLSLSDTTSFPRTLFTFTGGKLSAEGVDLRKSGGGAELRIKALKFIAPDIKIYKFDRPGQTFTADEHAADAAMPSKISVGRIDVTGGSVERIRIAGNDTVRTIVTGIEFGIDDFSTCGDTRCLQNPHSNRSVHLFTAKISYRPEGGSTRLEIDSIRIDTGAGSLDFTRLALIPEHGKNDFALKSHRHKDWTSAVVNGVSCSGVDYSGLLNDSVLKIDTVSITDGEINSYKNRNIKRTEWVKPLFHRAIQRLPVRIGIGKVNVDRLDAGYEELAAGGSTPGKIDVKNIRGVISNLTNITPSDKPYVRMDLAGTIGGNGGIKTTIHLPVDSLDDRFEIDATLGRFDLTSLNTAATPLLDVRIDEGVADGMTVRIVGTSEKATADMIFLYHDLRITILKEKNFVLKERKFISALLNALVIRDSNPGRNGVKKAHTETLRDPYRSPFNFMWHTIFDGAKETMGI